MGRTLTVTDFKGQTVLYRYDDSAAAGGRMFAEYRYASTKTVDGTTILNPESSSLTSARWYDEKTVYAYDALGRQSAVTEYAKNQSTGAVTATRATNYAYDTVTGSVTLVDGPEGKVHHEYDDVTGRLTETWTGPDDQHKSTSTLYGYDALGRLASVSSARVNGDPPAAPTVRRDQFDAVGGTAVAAASNTLPTTTYDYDAASNLDHVNLPNGIVEDYTYDDLNRLTHLTTTNKDDYKLFEQAYTLRADGMRDDVLETRYSGGNNSTPLSRTLIDWDYDALGRLTSERRDVGNDGQGNDDYVATYAYDLAGNRLSKVFNSATNSHDETIAYTYDNRDRLLSEDSDTDNTHDVTYKYDPNGSMTEQVKGASGSTITTRYLWDLRNRLTAVDGDTTHNADDLSINATTGVTTGTVNDSADMTYGYNGDGIRVAKTPGGSPTNAQKAQYLNDPANPTGYSKVLEQRDGGGGLVVTYVLGHDVLGQARAADMHALKYLLKDGRGTTRALTSAGGAVESGQTYDFQAFGEPIGFDPNAPTTATAYLQPDGLHDVETGFEYQLARYRNGFVFVSADDTEYGSPADPRTLHLYNYTSADPINRTDPTGHFELGINGMLGVLGIGMALQAMFLPRAAEGWKAGQQFEVMLWFNGTPAASPLQTFAWEDPLSEGVRKGLIALNELLNPEGGPGFWEGLIPVWGAGKTAGAHLANGNFLAAAFFAAWGVMDIVTLGTLTVGLRNAAREVTTEAARTISLKVLQGSCFAAGTRVVTGENQDGELALKPIEEIHVGDLVLARDQNDESDELDLRRVTRVFTKISDHVRVVALQAGDSHIETIKTTDDHPFWLAGLGWVAAKDLVVGDALSQSNGQTLAVVSTTREEHPEGITVYNLEVEQDHTYFVEDGSGQVSAVWVHNTCQLHHAISRRVLKAIERHPNLAGAIPRETKELMTRAADAASHGGYQEWHRVLDKEIIEAIEANPGWQPLDFIDFLVQRYNQPDLMARFPQGLGRG